MSNWKNVGGWVATGRIGRPSAGATTCSQTLNDTVIEVTACEVTREERYPHPPLSHAEQMPGRGQRASSTPESSKATKDGVLYRAFLPGSLSVMAYQPGTSR